MKRYLFCFLCSAACLSGAIVELYEDWRPDAVGDASFVGPLDGSASFYSLIRDAVEEVGYSIRHWDRVAHTPQLRTWKSVHSWKEFGQWLFRKKTLADDAAYIVFCDLGPYLRDLEVGRLGKERMILFAWEPPTVQSEIWEKRCQDWFCKIYTGSSSILPKRTELKAPAIELFFLG